MKKSSIAMIAMLTATVVAGTVLTRHDQNGHAVPYVGTSTVSSGVSPTIRTVGVPPVPSLAVRTIGVPPVPSIVFAPTPISVHPITTSNGQTSL